MKIKVDRVNSITEASLLKQLGVDFISIPFSKSLVFVDDRFCDFERGLSIIKTFGFNKSIAEISFLSEWQKALEFVIRNGIKYIQPISGEELDIEVAREFLNQGVGVVFSNIYISYDEELDWFLGQYSSLKGKEQFFLQVDLLGDIDGAWDFLKNECPKYPEELQINEISAASEEYKMFGILDFDYKNIKEIASAFPSFYGITFILGEESKLNNNHYLFLEDAISLIRKIKISPS